MEGYCIYCDREIADVEEVPQVEDESAWARLAAEHTDYCDWITTRAHRIYMD